MYTLKNFIKYCEEKNIKAINWCLKNKSIPFFFNDEHIGISEICDTISIPVLKLLINSNKINFNERDFYGLTCFMKFCHYDMTDRVELLLNASNIRLNSVSMYGETAFSIACCQNNFNTVKLLLNDARIDTYFWDNTKQIVNNTKNYKIKRILEKYYIKNSTTLNNLDFNII